MKAIQFTKLFKISPQVANYWIHNEISWVQSLNGSLNNKIGIAGFFLK